MHANGGVAQELLLLQKREKEKERELKLVKKELQRKDSALAEAAAIISGTPGALNLRTLNTIERISTEPSQKTTMLFPIEFIDAMRDIGTGLNRK